MRIFLLFFLLVILTDLITLGQSKGAIQRFIGNNDNTCQFFQYKSQMSTNPPEILVYTLNANKIIELKSKSIWSSEEVKIFYSKEVEAFFNYRDNKLRLKLNGVDRVFELNDDINVFGNNFMANSNGDSLFISPYSESSIYLFKKNTFELIQLPLFGSNLYLKEGYLFFESPRYSDNYSSYPFDIYRVKLSDLKNPERVLIQVNKWYPYTSNILYASTDPFLRIDDRKTYGVYDLLNRRVSESVGIATQNIIELNGNAYLLDQKKMQEQNGIQLEEVPKPPSLFPYEIDKVNSQTPRGNLFLYNNIPLNEKTLPDTFISHDLLYQASPEELEQLTKDQLRILRNTFFAFQGYKFSDLELTDFFNQFDWYKKMSMGDKRNEDVVIWPDEKERVDLISRIEQSK